MVTGGVFSSVSSGTIIILLFVLAKENPPRAVGGVYSLLDFSFLVLSTCGDSASPGCEEEGAAAFVETLLKYENSEFLDAIRFTTVV